MNRSLKAIIQLIALISFIVALCAWTMSKYPDEVVWACRIVGPIVLVALCYLLYRLDRRPDLAPDLLRQQFGTYFERDGLCFVPVLGISGEDGHCWCSIYFQNRYAGACSCDVVIQPGGKSFRLTRHKVSTIAVTIDCLGGDVGVVRVPYPVPADYRGKSVPYEVAARTKYPDGAGKLLRFRDGMRVGGHTHALGQAAKTLGLAAVGVISYSKPAGVTFTLPANAPETSPPGATMRTEVLWSFDAPTGGFPVVTPGVEVEQRNS